MITPIRTHGPAPKADPALIGVARHPKPVYGGWSFQGRPLLRLSILRLIEGHARPRRPVERAPVRIEGCRVYFD